MKEENRPVKEKRYGWSDLPAAWRYACYGFLWILSTNAITFIPVWFTVIGLFVVLLIGLLKIRGEYYEEQ